MPSVSLFPFGLCFVGLAACAHGAVTLTPTDDNNTLRSSNGDDVQPADATSLSLKEATTDQVNSRTAFIKFNTATASTALDGNLATLGLTVSGASPVGALFNLRVYALNTGAAAVTRYDWTEGTITWATSPAVSSSTGTFYLDQTLLTQVGSFDVANGTAVGTQFTIPFSNWSNFVQADSTLTLIVAVTNQSNGTPSLTFASSESTTPGAAPLLTIIPEPGSVSLGLLAGMAWIGRRRR